QQMKVPSISSDLQWKKREKSMESPQDRERMKNEEEVTETQKSISTTTTSTTTAPSTRNPNIIAAEMMRAKLKGDKSKLEKLQKELEECKSRKEENEVIAVPLDERGRPISLDIPE